MRRDALRIGVGMLAVACVLSLAGIAGAQTYVQMAATQMGAAYNPGVAPLGIPGHVSDTYGGLDHILSGFQGTPYDQSDGMFRMTPSPLGAAAGNVPDFNWVAMGGGFVSWAFEHPSTQFLIHECINVGSDLPHQAYEARVFGVDDFGHEVPGLIVELYELGWDPLSIEDSSRRMVFPVPVRYMVADEGAHYVLEQNDYHWSGSGLVDAITEVPLIPVADAGADQSVDEGVVVGLNGNGSSDPNGAALSYAWTQLAGPVVTLTGASSATPAFTAPAVALGGATLTFELVVSDAYGSSSPDTVDVTVGNVNHAPVALAGDDQTVAEGSPVTLDGSASYDADGDALTRSWIQTSGPAVALDQSDPVRPTLVAPLVGVAGATLEFRLTVGDGLASSSDTVLVRVENVNHAPLANAGLDQTRGEGALVALDGSGSSDPDGDALAYQWEQTGGAPVTLTDPQSASPAFVAPVVGPAGDTLTFRLTVDDGYGGTASDDVSITVQDSNSAPACGLARPSVTELWPPNHKMVAVSILGVTDPDSNQVSIQIVNVTQDEPINGLGDGDTSPDAILEGGTVLLRAERSGTGNGRVYRITFMADDGMGGTCSGQVTVCVPHDKGKNGSTCVDDGAVYSSLH